jgi:putative DNA modification/repair radical SAM protein
METIQKLTILTNSAKYDVACTSSGVDREGRPGGIGSAVACGICHSFASDGRCISLLKVLMTNSCIYDCQYCVNRVSNDVPRATFAPRELADLTIQFYRRNYIEGLFLSSGILKNPDYTCERMIQTLTLLREEYRFDGYIHAKAIPGADPQLLTQLGHLADRMSVNIELPSEKSLRQLAPQKTKTSILRPMGLIRGKLEENSYDMVRYRHTPKFAPAGQSTQMIIGATPDTDYQIMSLAEGLYQRYALKRVFYSAYMPVSNNPLLPAVTTKPPLLREHRLYQADWLLRYYGFTTDELLDEAHQDLNPLVDPKCSWALSHLDFFPVEINRADYKTLLRVPGIGVNSAKRILRARRSGSLDFAGLKKIGVVLKRAQYFIVCSGKMLEGLRATPDGMLRSLIAEQGRTLPLQQPYEQLSLFHARDMIQEGVMQWLT